LTGALSNLIWGLSGINPAYTPYFYVAGVIGLLAGVFANLGWAKKWWLWLLGGLITGVVAAIIGAPLTAYLYGGVTGSGTDLIVAALRASGANVIQAAFGQGIVSDPVDKVASFLIVWLIVKALPLRFRARFPRADNLPA
jgi:energy-coupling factor transport system substrate-specific component